jgi:diguanylate cyclase (GGDEF)-like protein
MGFTREEVLGTSDVYRDFYEIEWPSRLRSKEAYDRLLIEIRKLFGEKSDSSRMKALAKMLGALEIRDEWQQTLIEDLLENNKLLAEMLFQDELTGLQSKRGMDQASFILANAVRARVPWVVVFVDADNLHATNNTYGYEAGNSMLKAAASVLKCYYREVDLKVRWGGDEMIVVPDLRTELPEGWVTPQAIALAIASRHASSEVFRFEFQGAPHSLPLHLSVGMCVGLPVEGKPEYSFTTWSLSDFGVMDARCAEEPIMVPGHTQEQRKKTVELTVAWASDAMRKAKEANKRGR